MKIDQFPTEVLMEIFSYVPLYDEVSLVNKRFYTVACKVNDPNICLRIDSYFNWDWLPSIINSTKEVSKVDIEIPHSYELTETKLRTIISIIKKFSASIKYLKLICFKDLTLPQFLDVLSLVPNVEHLILIGFTLVRNQPTKEKTSSKDDLELQQLKKLEFSHGHDEFLAVFNRLPVGVLQDLELNDINSNVLVVLFKRQINIKKLKLDRVDFTTTIAADIFDNLKLESFEFRVSFNIATLLSKQTKLKSLKISGVRIHVDEDFINLVATQFTELETFHIGFVSKTTSASFVAEISKLKTLKNLSLWCRSRYHLKSWAKFHNQRITELSVFCRKWKHSHIHALSNSMPSLKVFRAFIEGNPQIVNAIMRNFNFVEVLHILNCHGISQLTEGDCFNPNLMELVIDCSLDEAFLNKLIADYPNLTKFNSSHRVSSTQFKRILKGFTKLESLKLDDALDLTMDDLKYLMESQHNLKFISLGFLYGCGGLSVKLKRQFSAAFGMVIISRDRTLRMAVDRNTMNSEQCFWL